MEILGGPILAKTGGFRALRYLPVTLVRLFVANSLIISINQRLSYCVPISGASLDAITTVVDCG
jgi:hypothetical protein